MAITTVSSHVVSVNAIQGTLIADNAITAVHIATNAVSGTLIADNAITAVHVAQNSITVTQLADDCVESDKIADGVITTNHLNKAMISSQTEVTPVAGDFVLLGDTSDSNNLKKAPLTLLLNSNVDLSTKAPLANPTLTGSLTVEPTAATGLSYAADGTNSFINFEANSVAASVQLYAGQSSGGYFSIGTKNSSGTLAEKMRITPTGTVGIGTTTPSQLLTVEGSSFPILQISNTDANNPANAVALDLVEKQTGYAAATATFGQTGVYGYRLKLDGSSNDLILQSGSQTTVTDRITIERDTGTVGIGTTSPSGNITISNGLASAPTSITAANSYIQIGSNDYGSGALGKFMIGFGYTDVLVNTNSPAYIGFEETSTSGDTKGNLTFYTRDVITDTAPTERMRIDSSGDINLVKAGTAQANLNFTTDGSLDYARITGGKSGSGVGDLRFFTYSGGIAERMRIDSSGNVLINSTAVKNLGFNTKVQIEGTGATSASQAIIRNSNSIDPPYLIFGKSRGTSNASNTIVQDNDHLGRIRWMGADGNDMASAAAEINAYVDGTPGSNDMPGALTFSTTADGAASSTERMRISSSGCVGIGSGADRSLGTNIGTLVVNGSAGGGLWLSPGDSSAMTSKIYAQSNGSVGDLIINNGTGVGSGGIRIQTNGSQKMIIDSAGRLLINSNTASPVNAGNHKLVVELDSSTAGIAVGADGLVDSRQAIGFYNDNGTVGTIITSGSSTAYNTSSDYRLKENVDYTWDATTRLKQLKPARFNFIADADTIVDGFLAHEVQSIVPEAITGEKDGTEMQGIDQSKLVPLLVKTIQEQQTIIDDLKSRLDNAGL